ncbi:cytoplasmic dynein 1 intermediate chain 2, partial [Exaiptasia diaphana]
MSDRKAELERKRKRLEEIRRARNEKKKNEQESARQTATSASTESATERKQRETDELLKGILPDDVIDGSAVTVALQKPATTKAEGSPVKAPMTQIIQKKAPVLVVSQTAQTNIPPKEPVLYSKETQTPVLTNQKDDDDEDEDIKKLKKPEIIAAPEPEVREEHKEEEPVIELSDDQKEQILNSQEFGKFFDKATRLMERALCEDIDIFMDYSGAEAEDQDKGAEASSQLTMSRDFYDERWSKHRTVTCMDWSTQYPELLVASYNNNEDLPHEPDGVALIWNLKFSKTTPEYVFHCQSAVMSATFAKFHPNLIV